MFIHKLKRLSLNNFERRNLSMSLRPNEAQELYDAYAFDDNYSYSCAYEGCPEGNSFSSEELDDASSYGKDRTQRSMRRRKTLRAKRRFFTTTSVAAKNLRARYVKEDSAHYPLNKSYVVIAERLIKTAKKMGMDI